MLSPMTGYAATALAWLAGRTDGPAQVRDIAVGAGVPAAYLGKIMHLLARRGVVVTKRGIGGGVRLESDPKALTLFDLAEALDDPILTPKCMLGVEDCSDQRACPAHAFWKAHRDRELAFLRKTTVEDIRKFEERRSRGIAPTINGATPNQGNSGVKERQS